MEPTEQAGSAPPGEGSADRVRVPLAAADTLVRGARRHRPVDVPGRSPLEEAAASPGPRGLRLTPRQRAILRLAALGHTDKEIAGTLGVSYHTVRTHFVRLCRAHGAPNRTALVALWLASLAEGGSASLGGFDWLGALVSLFLGTGAWHENCSRPGERMGRCSADSDPRASPSTEEASTAGPVRGKEVTPVGEDGRRRGGRANPIRVVIAEDDSTARSAVRSLLEEEPDIAVVGEAADGVEAIYSTQRLRPDVLLLDLAMPMMGGVQAAMVLRRTAPETRIVVLTCPAHASELLRLDVHGYLCKPVQGPELADAIRAVHRGGICLQPAVVERLVSGARSSTEADPTSQDLAVLRLAAQGGTDKEIARRLGVGSSTVRGHFTKLFRKLGVGSKAELLLRAHERGWLGPDPCKNL
jgi:DNA-binding NarL/FixJ family response regulator